MHKTILFLLAFLITPITASYAVVGNTEITVNPDGSGSSSVGGTTVPGTTTTPCADRTCLLTSKETNNKKDDFAGCVWIDIPQGAILTNGVISGDGKCQKKWYCQKDGYYTKVYTKPTNNDTAITNRFSHVSCEPCPYACKEGDDDCIQKAKQTQETNNVTTKHATNNELGNYSPAQSVNECYLKILYSDTTTTGSDEIGSFRTKKSSSSYTCRY